RHGQEPAAAAMDVLLHRYGGHEGHCASPTACRSSCATSAERRRPKAGHGMATVLTYLVSQRSPRWRTPMVPAGPGTYVPLGVPLGVPLLGPSLGLSLGLGALLRLGPPPPSPDVEEAPAATPVLTVTSADGTTRPLQGCWQEVAVEPKARSALTNHPKRAATLREPSTLQQLLEPDLDRALEPTLLEPALEPAPEPTLRPALEPVLEPSTPGAARAFEREGAVPKIRPTPAACADTEPYDEEEEEEDREPPTRRRCFVDRDEMDDIGERLDSILAVNRLGLLSMFEAMTDTSDLADLDGHGSDSDDTLVGTPPGSPTSSPTGSPPPPYSVTFPGDALSIGADPGHTEHLAADVCFHHGGVDLDGASKASVLYVSADSDDAVARFDELRDAAFAIQSVQAWEYKDLAHVDVDSDIA
ncbi:Zinc metalloprotease, partial [Frankliniella fusca]